MSSDPVQGLTKRPPTDLVASLGTAPVQNAWHDFETKNGRKFLAQFHDGTVHVRDLNGDMKTVTVQADAAAYLANPGAMRFTTTEDDTIVVDTERTVSMASDTMVFANQGAAMARGTMGIIQVLGGLFSRHYRIFKDGVQIADMETSNGENAGHNQSLATGNIAGDIYNRLLPNLPAADGWVVTRQQDIILITNTNKVPFLLTSTDDAGDVNMKVMTNQVSAIEDLPRRAPKGYVVRVATETDPEEDLWFQYITEDTSIAVGQGFGQDGYWQETVAPDIKYKLNTATMPHVLDYTATTDSFVFRRGNWRERRVGTLISNPEPSFVDRAITDVATFQSRLVFLAGSNIIMSRTKRTEDFWFASAAELVDTDPIDISSTAVEASIMRAVVPYNRDLVVFSSKGQFIVFGRTGITPENASLVLTTSFEAELYAKPAPAGKNVFFANNFGRFTGIREFYTEGSSEVNDTRPVTQHIKEYIVGRVERLTASSNYDMLLVQTQSDRRVVYPYQYIWNDNEKIQSSWSQWRMDNLVDYMFFDQSTVYFVLQKGTEYWLQRMDLDVQSSDGMNFPIYLDGRFDVADCYTQFVLPFNRLYDANLQVVQGPGCPNPGMSVPIDKIEYVTAQSGYVVTLRYDMQGGDIVVGTKYMSRYRPTMPFVKDQDGVVIATGNLRVKMFIVSMDKTGIITGQLMSRYGNGPEIRFEGRVIGETDNLVGSTVLSNDKFYMPFREDTQRADFIMYSDDFTPMTFLDIEWVGQYTKQGKRIATGGD